MSPQDIESEVEAKEEVVVTDIETDVLLARWWWYYWQVVVDASVRLTG